MAIFPSQGGSKNTWGTELRNFFSNMFNLSTGYFSDPWIDSRSYSTLALADAAAVAAGKPLLIASGRTVSTATTFSSNVVMKKGGLFTKSGSGTITFNASFEAGMYQVFSGFATGNVIFSAGTVEKVNVKWFGAIGDLSNDDYSAIETARAAAQGKAKTYFPVPSSGWKIGTGISLTTYDHLYFEGVNTGRGTLLNYIKPTSAVTTAIMSSQTDGIKIEGLGLDMASMADGSVGVHMQAVQFGQLKNIVIQDVLGVNSKGFQFSTYASGHGSSIWGVGENLVVSRVTAGTGGVGFYIDDQNSKNIGWVLNGTRAVSMTRGYYINNVSSSMIFISPNAESCSSHGIDVGSISSGAQVNFIGGEVSGNTGYGFNVTANSRIVIDGTVMSTNTAGDVNWAAATEGRVVRIRQNNRMPVSISSNTDANAIFTIAAESGTTTIKHGSASNQLIDWQGYSTGPNYFHHKMYSSNDYTLDLNSYGTAYQPLRWGIDNWSDGTRFYLYGTGVDPNESAGIGFYEGTGATSTDIIQWDQYGKLSATSFKSDTQTLTYANPVVVNVRSGSAMILTVTDGNAFTIGNPANDENGDELEFIIYNNSGGAMGAITWSGDYKVSGWTEPANGKYKTIRFRKIGNLLFQIGTPSGDI